MPHQAHDVAAGVEIEGARFARGPHIGFVRKLVALAAVAGMAAGDQVLPGGQTAAGTRDDVIEREFARGQRGAAVLARVTVAQQDVLARESARLVRNAPILEQTDHRGHTDGNAGGVQEVSVFLFGHGDALEHEDDGAARGAHVDRLVRGVQDEDRRVQGVAVALLVEASGQERDRRVVANRVEKLAGHE